MVYFNEYFNFNYWMSSGYEGSSRDLKMAFAAKTTKSVHEFGTTRHGMIEADQPFYEPYIRLPKKVSRTDGSKPKGKRSLNRDADTSPMA